MSTYVFEDVVRVLLAILDVVNENVVNCFFSQVCLQTALFGSVFKF